MRRRGRGTGLTPGVSREGCDGARDSERLLWIVRGQGWEQRARGPWSRREMAIQRRGRGDVDACEGGSEAGPRDRGWPAWGLSACADGALPREEGAVGGRVQRHHQEHSQPRRPHDRL